MKYGLKGIGAYWCIIEMLYEEVGYISIKEYERIAFELRTDKEFIKSIIEGFELFIIKDEMFSSESAIERIKQRMDKSDKARESVNARWNKYERNTNVIGTKSDSNTIKVKESKVKVNKEKENVVYPFTEKEFIKAWKVWTEYKQTQFSFKYKSISTEQTALNNLKKLSNENLQDALEIINRSIANGWKGFFALKKEANQIDNMDAGPDFEF